MARFVAEHSHPATHPATNLLLLATALVAQAEGQGHACLPLGALLQAPDELLGWPPDAVAALHAVLATLPPDLPAWQAALRASPAVAWASPGVGVGLGAGVGAGHRAGQGSEPLVLDGDRLYLRRCWQQEQRLAAQVLLRGQADGAVDVAMARTWLDRLFAPTPHFDWQKAACAVALRGRLTLITGGPGTGKTFTAARLLALLLALSPRPDQLRIALAAPTGKAAARLRQSIEGALLPLQHSLGDALPLQGLLAQVRGACTLHRLLGARPGTRHFRHSAARPLEVDVLVVDEASMVHLEMMAALLDALPPTARVVLLGDPDQLASVEAGAVLADLCRAPAGGRYGPATQRYLRATTGQQIDAASADAAADDSAPALARQTVVLRHSRRFGGAIGALALAVKAGDAGAAAAVFKSGSANGSANGSASGSGDGSADGSASGSADGQGSAVCWLPRSTPATVLDLARAGRAAAPGGYAPCLALLAQRPAAAAGPRLRDAWVRAVLQAFDRFRVLCAVREGDWGVHSLNRAITAHLRQAGLLPGSGEWYHGRPVIVTRNDPALGVFNGDIGIALRAGDGDGDIGRDFGRDLGGDLGGASAAQPGAPPAFSKGGLRVWFADGASGDAALRSVSVSRLGAVETAFAMTVHKAQGSEFEHTVLVLPGGTAASRAATRELVYTGITRARSALTLVSAQPEALAWALARRTRRASGLADLLGAAASGC